MQFLHKAELEKLDFTTTVNPYFRGFQRKYKYMVRYNELEGQKLVLSCNFQDYFNTLR